MVAGLNAVVWERDPRTWQIRFVNDRIEELLGHPREEWLADPDLWRRSLHPDDRDRVLRAVTDAVEARTDFALTYRIRSAAGRLLWLHHLGHVAGDEPAEPLALHAVLIDVTAQRRREEAAELLAAASSALAGLGHGGGTADRRRRPHGRARSATGPASGCAGTTAGTRPWPRRRKSSRSTCSVSRP